jgi:UDP-2,4-diacetamido-2,4,6-trideoxy-beta-L-altropyranose hydrolase
VTVPDNPSNSIRLLIRADASSQIGNGHVMRMLALAQACRDRGGSVSLATRACPDSTLQRFSDEGIRILWLKAQSALEDALALKSMASAGSFDWIVLDGYSFDAGYQAIVRAGNQRLMVVDDYLHHSCYAADVILNQNIGVGSNDYRDCAPDARVLAGLDYVLLRREFVGSMATRYGLDLQSKACSSIHPQKVLITLGGSDPQNLSPILVEALAELVEPFGLQVRLLVGSSNPHWQRLLILADKRPWLTVLKDVFGMGEQYVWADLAIVGGGSTNWELCRFGIPRLVIVLAENQAPIASGLESAGVAINLGEGNRLCPSKITESIRCLLLDPQARQMQSRRALQLVDGRGAERVVDYLVEFLNSNNPTCPIL